MRQTRKYLHVQVGTGNFEDWDQLGPSGINCDDVCKRACPLRSSLEPSHLPELPVSGWEVLGCEVGLVACSSVASLSIDKVESNQQQSSELRAPRRQTCCWITSSRRLCCDTTQLPG